MDNKGSRRTSPGVSERPLMGDDWIFRLDELSSPSLAIPPNPDSGLGKDAAVEASAKLAVIAGEQHVTPSPMDSRDIPPQSDENIGLGVPPASKESLNSTPSPADTASAPSPWQHVPVAATLGGYTHSNNGTSPDERAFPEAGQFGTPDKPRLIGSTAAQQNDGDAEPQFIHSDDACLSFAEKLPSRTARGPNSSPKLTSEGIRESWTDLCPPRMPVTPAQGLWTSDGSRGEEGNQAVTPPNRKRSKSPRDVGDLQRGERRPSPGAAKLPPGSRMGSNEGSNGPSRKSSRERNQSRNREWRYFNGSDQSGHFEEPPLREEKQLPRQRR